jgi:hypothetical protein
MSLHCMRDGLMSNVNGAPAKVLFAAAKTRHSAFSKCDSPAAVLAAMSDVPKASWVERERLTRALLAETQTQPHSFWTALLLAAYYPMLLRLRGRIRGRIFDSVELDQLVVATFIEVARAFPLDQRKNRTCMYLRQMTERRVFQVVRLESAMREMTSFQLVENVDLTKLPPWPSPRLRHGTKTDPAPVDDSEAVALLASRASSVSQEQIALLVATMVRGEPLRLYVARAFAQYDPVERDRLYQRLKRQRARTLIRLRPAFADLRGGELGEPEVFLTGSQPE